MANAEIARMSKRVVQYFWDPLPRNDDRSTLWCLGRSYDSRYNARSQAQPAAGTSPASDSGVSQADSAVVTETSKSEEKETQSQMSASEEEALGWPSEFLDDLEARIWLTYRNNFPPIAKSTDPAASAAMSFSTRMRNLTNQGGFTSDTGWGCMIRSGQSLLANTLAVLLLGADWRVGQQTEKHRELIGLFADDPAAQFSIHKFVEHGAAACGKHPGEWFGPSATAWCIKALAEKHEPIGLRVYVRSDDSDVYVDKVFATASQRSADDEFQPTLILLGVRLGIDRITPVYHAGLKYLLELPQSVGIAGGRPSSSHYFIGHQGDNFFYLDPHSTRAPVSAHPSDEDVASCHTRRVRRLKIQEMDPSMLLGFLVKSKEDFAAWRTAVESTEGKAIIHVHDKEPQYATGPERPGAIDEVETWTGDDDD